MKEEFQIGDAGVGQEGAAEEEQGRQDHSSVPSIHVPRWAEKTPDKLSRSDYTTALARWLIDGGFAVVRADEQGGGERTKAANTPATMAADQVPVDFDPFNDEDDLAELQPEEDDDIKLEEEDANTASVGGETLTRRKTKGKNKKTRAALEEFMEKVKQMEDGELRTPRCNTLLELYDRIQRDFPGEKIIIWSRFYKALALVQEAFKRFKNVPAYIFSGVLGTAERTRLLTKWEDPELTPSTTPILFQAKAGNTGLTINAASHAIFLEDWWNRQNSVQAERRSARVGQTKKVHIWRLFATNSFADAIIESGGLRKLRTIDRLYSALRPPPDQELEIPEWTPQFGNIGYVNYRLARRVDTQAEKARKEARRKARDASRAQAEGAGENTRGAGEAAEAEERGRKRQKTEAGEDTVLEGETVMMDVEHERGLSN